MPDDDNDDDYIKGRQTDSLLFFLHFISWGLSVFLSHRPHPGAKSSVYQIISGSRPFHRNSHLTSITGPFAKASEVYAGITGA